MWMCDQEDCCAGSENGGIQELHDHMEQANHMEAWFNDGHTSFIVDVICQGGNFYFRHTPLTGFFRMRNVN